MHTPVHPDSRLPFEATPPRPWRLPSAGLLLLLGACVLLAGVARGLHYDVMALSWLPDLLALEYAFTAQAGHLPYFAFMFGALFAVQDRTYKAFVERACPVLMEGRPLSDTDFATAVRLRRQMARVQRAFGYLVFWPSLVVAGVCLVGKLAAGVTPSIGVTVVSGVMLCAFGLAFIAPYAAPKLRAPVLRELEGVLAETRADWPASDPRPCNWISLVEDSMGAHLWSANAWSMADQCAILLHAISHQHGRLEQLKSLHRPPAFSRF